MDEISSLDFNLAYSSNNLDLEESLILQYLLPQHPTTR
jgi:hypothetical protein